VSAAVSGGLMLLLVDENVPNSVAEFFASRGHEVRYVRDVLPAGTPDPVIAAVGDRIGAVVVTWDKDFDKLVSRVPEGNKNAFRRLGRISFRCDYAKGRALAEKWIEHIEFHYRRACEDSDIRMICQVQESGFKAW
jgi:predicted nuclease of predicted toxin-antitoxin system